MRFPVIAIYDACALYPAPLRDLLIRLAQADLVRAHGTTQIHDEWMRNVLRDNPAIAPDRLERTRTLMDAAVRDCLVTGYEELIETVTLPDPDDRHVLAAAIRAGADVIVTFNLGDFPTEILAPPRSRGTTPRRVRHAPARFGSGHGCRRSQTPA